MIKFVKFTRGRREIVGMIVTFMGARRGYVEVTYHNGMKPTTETIERKKLTKITAKEFERAVRKSGDTFMLLMMYRRN